MYHELAETIEIGSIKTFTLQQNYPNPFNPATTIIYQLPTEGQVSLKIYDMLGNEVATLVNEMKTAGEYQVDFNAAALSSGIYFYRLQAGNFVETKRMMLMK
ncbi:MAG: T9SS type A sorting domain-containing protein [Ignavibacteriaceae bacterium]|nr:T9SS type A sorting domain-containing protein [Ignavibacteriaceae bacterium]